jgi:predicted house-cleaning NTP pyrophosphatase (Maf/HAM1 superfamily)
VVRLILASASPRRAELLRAAGYEFDVVVMDVDESIRPGETRPASHLRSDRRPRSYGGRVAGSAKVRLKADTPYR